MKTFDYAGEHIVRATGFTKQQAEFDYIVQKASELLGAPGRGVVVDWRLHARLKKAGRLEARQGVEGPLPVQGFGSFRRGHRAIVALERYRLQLNGQVLRAVVVVNGFKSQLPSRMDEPWVVAEADYTRFYRLVRGLARETERDGQPAPVMPADEQKRLHDNTLGFLTHGVELLKQYDVPQKRGVLLTGPPGNGKTMACRWLRSQCREHGFEWRHVEVDEYENARDSHDMRHLFHLDDPGIVLLDDFDLGLRDREKVGPTPLHSILLTALDGVDQHHGIVYLFTTNAALSDLDPAFLRRGRIDQVIHFPPPNAEQRRRLIREFWHADIVAAIDVEAVVACTAGRSFAEVAELKKLLVLGHLDTGRWDWQQAWETLVRNDSAAKGRLIGFAGPAREQASHAGAGMGFSRNKYE